MSQVCRSLVLQGLLGAALLGCGASSGTPGATGGTQGTGSGGVASGGTTATGGAAGSIGTGGAAGMPSGAGGDRAGTGGRIGGLGGASGGAAGGGAPGGGGISGGGGLDCPGDSADSASPPKTLTLSGNLGAHDPAAYVVGSTIYLAATGLSAKTSTNLTSWAAAPSPLALPAWAKTATGATNLWAPDISYFGGAYHLYYAASTFGSNKSCIGQATRAALDSGSWADQGMVICSNMGETD
ncbi:MAG: family 43 glycosylhydrolase, partial [Pseudomonadota bacterium]